VSPSAERFDREPPSNEGDVVERGDMWRSELKDALAGNRGKLSPLILNDIIFINRMRWRGIGVS
jgi:hypothetical protein